MPSKSTPLTKVFVWNESFDLFKILYLQKKIEKNQSNYNSNFFFFKKKLYTVTCLAYL